MSSIDFSNGTYNPSTKVFTTANGEQYYISADNCGTSLLVQNCNTQWCDWNEDATGKASCPQPCSSYVYKQYSECPGGTCDDLGSKSKVRYLPCGPNPCATKGLTNYGDCSAKCGGGKQSRSCKISPMGLYTNMPSDFKIDTPVSYKDNYIPMVADQQTKSGFSNRSYISGAPAMSRPIRPVPAPYIPPKKRSNFTSNPYDLIDDRF